MKSLKTNGKIEKTLASSATSTSKQLAFISNLGPRYIPRGAELSSVYITAAPELNSKFRDAQNRADKFGGDPDKWVKKAGKVESAQYVFDVHWEENISVGRVNWKIKYITEKR